MSSSMYCTAILLLSSTWFSSLCIFNHFQLQLHHISPMCFFPSPSFIQSSTTFNAFSFLFVVHYSLFLFLSVYTDFPRIYVCYIESYPNWDLSWCRSSVLAPTCQERDYGKHLDSVTHMASAWSNIAAAATFFAHIWTLDHILRFKIRLSTVHLCFQHTGVKHFPFLQHCNTLQQASALALPGAFGSIASALFDSLRRWIVLLHSSSLAYWLDDFYIAAEQITHLCFANLVNLIHNLSPFKWMMNLQVWHGL